MLYNDWFGNLSNINVGCAHYSNYYDICIVAAIRELCEVRDRGLPQFGDTNQLNFIINIV